MAVSTSLTYDAPFGSLGSEAPDADQRREGPFSLGEQASAVYDRLAILRSPVHLTAIEMAELTIPSLVPPIGWKVGTKIPGNNQSLGARCVNTLASSLTFIAFPPNQPIMRLQAIEYEIQAEVDKDPELYVKMQVALGRLAEAHRQRLMSGTTMLSAYSVAMKQLLVAGNCLWRHTELDSPTVHTVSHYVCMRNSHGDPTLSILKDTLMLDALPKDVQDIIMTTTPALKDKKAWETEVDIYSVCNLCFDDDGTKCWEYWQEYKGKLLPGTEVETDFDNAPMIPLWMIPVYGQNWGRSYCEEYRGDLFSVEALASAINDGAALNALSLLFVNPSGRTSLRQIREARNLSTFPGEAKDLTVFRADKAADLTFVQQTMDRVERRLSAAFLLNFSIQRAGERVTAEEIRRLGNELDKALGGLYSELAQRTQRPTMLRFMHLNEEENPKLPKLPPKMVQVQVITGVDALGNSKEAQDLEELAANVTKFFPRHATEVLNAQDWAMRYAATKGIKPDGLIATPDQMAAIAQAESAKGAQAALLNKGTGPGIAGLMDHLPAGALSPPPTGPDGLPPSPHALPPQPQSPLPPPGGY